MKILPKNDILNEFKNLKARKNRRN